MKVLHTTVEARVGPGQGGNGSLNRRPVPRDIPAPRRLRRVAAWRASALALALVTIWLPHRATALSISNQWISPRNRERPRREETRFIILHTTEGGSAGALQKLRRNGEAHYLVDEAGSVFRIIDHRRLAYHCGRSMWEGRTNLDAVSLGIEVAGYHNRDINAAQTRALAALLEELKRIYAIPDDRVLTHSMVAYGAPNRWHRSNHRGRKRCGMQFARWDVRRSIGLNAQPRFDPDVRAGRLVNADAFLAEALYGTARDQDRARQRYSESASNDVIAPNRTAWDIARDQYNSPNTVYHYPDGTQRRGDTIANWRAMPAGTRVQLGDEAGENEETMPRILGKHGNTPEALAGDEWRSPGTLYLFEDGRLVAGDTLSAEAATRLPEGLRVWIGYRIGGPISAGRRAFDICGPRWNAPDTFYLFPDGSLRAGDAVDERRIPNGTRILFRI